MNMIIKSAQKLMKIIREKQHPEYGMTKISGCQLSRSDVDIAILYLEEIIRNHGRFPTGLMEIHNSEISQLFELYGLPVKDESLW